MSEPETKQYYVCFTTQTFAKSPAEAISIGLMQFDTGNVHVSVTTDTPGEIHEFDDLPATTALAAYALKATDHSKRARKVLSERVKLIAPGFYIENDGGPWYCIAPGDVGRIADSFIRPTDALRMILCLAGDPLPNGWQVKPRTSKLSADIECGQGFDACLWRRDAAKLFPARMAELLPETADAATTSQRPL